jgi:7-cyano-7-deazaguanine synthase
MSLADKAGKAMTPSPSKTRSRAIVLVSGGLDSATVLAMARQQGYDCYALSFDYGQRHRVELSAAADVAARLGAREHRILKIDLGALGGSALTDSSIAVPEAPQSTTAASAIPVTYVPARNTIFLSFALAWAEVVGSNDIFIGVNAVDYSGYPDCRPEFIAAFERLATLATRAGVEGADHLTIHAPLIQMSKADIVRAALASGVDIAATVSCYQPDQTGAACARCDSCRLRAEAFVSAGVPDPTRYR